MNGLYDISDLFNPAPEINDCFAGPAQELISATNAWF